jgi:hypothetical protein
MKARADGLGGLTCHEISFQEHKDCECNRHSCIKTANAINVTEQASRLNCHFEATHTRSTNVPKRKSATNIFIFYSACFGFDKVVCLPPLGDTSYTVVWIVGVQTFTCVFQRFSRVSSRESMSVNKPSKRGTG